ncbi:hypothetical protein J6590_067926 [Homalodisca vitripennis]|nr:hypothetical protein J6590_067926 [Homalodisca vitripennis]
MSIIHQHICVEVLQKCARAPRQISTTVGTCLDKKMNEDKDDYGERGHSASCSQNADNKSACVAELSAALSRPPCAEAFQSRSNPVLPPPPQHSSNMFMNGS